MSGSPNSVERASAESEKVRGIWMCFLRWDIDFHDTYSSPSRYRQKHGSKWSVYDVTERHDSINLQTVYNTSRQVAILMSRRSPDWRIGNLGKMTNCRCQCNFCIRSVSWSFSFTDIRRREVKTKTNARFIVKKNWTEPEYTCVWMSKTENSFQVVIKTGSNSHWKSNWLQTEIRPFCIIWDAHRVIG